MSVFQAVATLRIEGCGPCEPDVGFDLHLDEYDRKFHGRDIDLYSGDDVRQLAEQRAELLEALRLAEAALSDIGDADREPGDDLAWCERRAAKDLPSIRAAIARATESKS